MSGTFWKVTDVIVRTPEEPLIQKTEGTATTVLPAVGHTPLIRLASIPWGFAGVEMYAKAEWLNPGWSVKNRPVLNMVLKGGRSGWRWEIISAPTIFRRKPDESHHPSAGALGAFWRPASGGPGGRHRELKTAEREREV